MQFFLRLKHWQLFVINFGIPIVLQIIFMCSIFGSLMGAPDTFNPPIIFMGFAWMFPLIVLISMFSLFGWLWSVSINLQKITPEHLKLKTTTFKVFLIIPVIYILCIMIGMAYVFTHFIGNSNPAPTFFAAFFLIIPIHLFSMFCIFYCFYFTARTIKTVELQRPVSTSDYIGEFFLIWFFFIGVWILQPRINKLANGEIPPINPTGFGEFDKPF
jgi:hypothetical protein